jgi:TolB-like protein
MGDHGAVEDSYQEGLAVARRQSAEFWSCGRPSTSPLVRPEQTRGCASSARPEANLGGDPSEQYLADVLTEELTTGLARLPGFPVIARSTAFTYKGKPVDVKQVGKELAVRYALEGSEQHSGDKVRVNAQLIDAESGTHLWVDQFDEGRSDLLQCRTTSSRASPDPCISSWSPSRPLASRDRAPARLAPTTSRCVAMRPV